MKVALSPMEFAKRARRLYAGKEAVVDGSLRFTYEEFFSRCDKWSAALQNMGVMHSDRVAYIAPNTHTHLEGYYAVPQMGAVLVPINYRLSADDFEYIINHCGAKVVCAHPDYFDAVDGIRDKLVSVENYIALEGEKSGWDDYEKLLANETGAYTHNQIDEDDLLTINYTSGTTARPKGVMITHRNAYMNIMGTLVHHHLTTNDRYLWTLPMFHANGWTFTWINTARGMAHICLRKVEPELIYKLIKEEQIPPADIIKMDIQGAELSALRGLGQYLNNVNVLELEVEFLPIYQNQPTFVDLHAFLLASGFHLQDLHLSKTFLTDGKTNNFYLKEFISASKNVDWTPQVYAGDAIYVKDLTAVLDLNLEQQINHLKCLCSYQCFDRVFLILSKSKYRSEIENSKFYSDLLAMAKKGRVKTRLLRVLSKIFRKLRIPVSSIFDKKYPWIKRTFPNI